MDANGWIIGYNKSMKTSQTKPCGCQDETCEQPCHCQDCDCGQVIDDETMLRDYPVLRKILEHEQCS